MTRLFVLRPGQPGHDLANMLTNQNFQARHAPSLAIKPQSFSLPNNTYDYVIFISPTAVTSAEAAVLELCANADGCIAVGSGTAAELQRIGITDTLVPEEFNSEGLLAMPDLQDIDQKRVLLVKGVGGRKLLADTLRDRGAACDLLDVYERVTQTINQSDWQWYLAGENRGITSASIETLEAFEQQRKAGDYPLPNFILVASDRIAETAEALGYTNIHNVGGAANQYFANALLDH